ncbi:uncharacterized protein LOC135812936 [Sycon ciliatum]|uniref:uncharacterized protein LOC135812936 n=1 Tax=Sycon ciliatum TaxID=27933 RepID=UPI0031F5F750
MEEDENCASCAQSPGSVGHLVASASTQVSEISWGSCLCHCVKIEGSEKEEKVNFTNTSWSRVVSAAKIRQDGTWAFLCQEQCSTDESTPRGWYHRRCYAAYTHKKTLSRFEGEESGGLASNVDAEEVGDADACEDEPPKKRVMTRSKVTTIDITLTVAALEAKKTTAVADDNVYDRAFEWLAVCMEKELFSETEIRAMRMDSLTSKYSAKLAELGAASQYRRWLLKKRLLEHFGKRINFVRPGPLSPESVLSSSLTESQLLQVVGAAVAKAEAAQQCADEYAGDDMADEDAPPAIDSSCKVHAFHTAMALNNAIRDQQPTIPTMPHASDIVNENAPVPDILYNVLAMTIVGPEKCDIGDLTDSRVHVPADIHCKILAIAEDIVYAATRGSILTPKHVALALTVHHHTRSKHMVDLLNQFGHGISYSKLREVETGYSLEVAGSSAASSVVVPRGISQRGGDVHFCWDNNDLNEETLSGQGTTPCTNGIVLQHSLPFQDDPCPPESTSRAEPGNQRRPRSVAPPAVPSLEYNCGARPRPPPMAHPVPDAQGSIDPFLTVASIDLIWFLLRADQTVSPKFGRPDDESQLVPAWSGFNAELNQSTAPGTPTTVGYLPIIPASPTAMSTVYELVVRSLRTSKKLNQPHCIITADQAVYAKAVEVCWKNAELKDVVLRMGAFHTSCAFLAVLGKRFGSAGLEDLLVESGVVGSNACKQVMAGKHYNRGVRLHKLAFECLLGVNWKLYEDSIEGGGDTVSSDLEGTLSALRTSGIFDGAESVTSSSSYQKLEQGYRKHVQLQRTSPASPMAQFWLTYLDMVGLLLQFIRATRTGNWSLHLACIENMLPWFFAYDRQNYSRYLSLYWQQMRQLPATNPPAHKALSGGCFSVARSTNSFSKVAVDQCIEQTINRQSKSHGGLIGFSRNPGTVHRWVLTAHERAAVASACNDLVKAEDYDGTARPHKDNTDSRMKRDQSDYGKLEKRLAEFSHPFLGEDLISLSSGKVCSAQATSDLLSSHTQGKSAMSKFVADRLESQAVDFFTPISRLNLKTFSETKSAAKKSSKTTAIVADRSLFGRLLVMAQSRSFDLKELFQHELGPVPWALANADGSLVKTPKSKLLLALEKKVDPLESVPRGPAVMVDAMALLQSYTSAPPTFGQLSEQVFKQLVSYLPATPPARVDFVADQYHTASIKSCERSKRTASTEPLRVAVQRPDQAIPTQWKRFMASGANKAGLIQFFADHWSSTPELKATLGVSRSVFITVGQQCYVLQEEEGKSTLSRHQVSRLTSNHEEADTRLILHAADAVQQGFPDVVIRSPDTDVAVIAIGSASSIPGRLIFQTGTQQRRRFIDLTQLSQTLGPLVSSAIVGLHALTGCDSVSSFSGKGKTAPLKLLLSSTRMAEALATLGVNATSDDQLLSECEWFACALYGNPGQQDINSQRYQKFCAATSCAPHKLPPSRDALHQHVARANYQAHIWRSATTAMPEVPSPVGHGWQSETDGTLSISWMLQRVAPADILKLVSCGCKTRHCVSQHCSCKKASLACTDICSCCSCANPFGAVLEQNDSSGAADVGTTACEGDQNSESEESTGADDFEESDSSSDSDEDPDQEFDDSL